MNETKTYSAMLCSIADEIEIEGRVTKACAELNGWTPERIRDAAAINDRQAMRIAELTLVLRQISEWAEPMREGPRDCIPNWFYEMRRVLAHNWAKEIEK